MNLKKQIEEYRMTDATKDLVQKTKLLLIASIAGGGKDTITKELVKTGEFHRIITHTTRQPRINHGIMEENGREYNFISVDDAEKLLESKVFVESKLVHGNVYGTSVAEIKLAHDENKTAVADIDIQGVLEYLAIKPDTHAIFLLPPSVDTWLNRLMNRYGNLDEHQEEIQTRFRTAYDEIKHIQDDERFILIINDELQATVDRVLGVVNGSVDHSSEYARKVTEHLLGFLETKI